MEAGGKEANLQAAPSSFGAPEIVDQPWGLSLFLKEHIVSLLSTTERIGTRTSGRFGLLSFWHVDACITTFPYQ